MREPPTKPGGRGRVYPITVQNNHILRSEFVLNVSQVAQSRRSDDVRLELGDHPMAEDLRGLKFGRLLQMQYMPHNQAILTPPLESYPK